MTTPSAGCAENIDPLKLVRDGTHQATRADLAPDPARVPSDERRPEHAMVFAAAYAKHLTYFDLDDTEQGNWHDFFAADVSAQLAVIATEDVAVYRTTVKELLRSLEDPELPASGQDMIAALGAVFDCLGTLARRLDALEAGLPADQPLRTILGDLIRSQLSPMLQRLIGYYLAGSALGVVDRTAPPSPDLLILGRGVESFEALITDAGLTSAGWPAGVGLPDWRAYAAVVEEPYRGAYGPAATTVDQVNHLATHNLFTAVCETFLAVYARVVDGARTELQATYEWDGHEPHYALFLAFLELLGHARDTANRVTAEHLEFYYRRVLQLEALPAEPGHAHVLVELAKHVDAHLLPAGTLLKAGKDDTGADAHFAIDRDLVANRSVVTDLTRIYRHRNTAAESLPSDDGRIFAAPVADVADVADVGASWHPFAEKVFTDGALTSIAMAPAEIGFAVASHHLWLAEGRRTISANLGITRDAVPFLARPLVIGRGLPRRGGPVRRRHIEVLCRLTTEDGWLDKLVTATRDVPGGFSVELTLDGNDPAITPYDPNVHGFGFATSVPVLLVLLRHRPGVPWDGVALAGARVSEVELQVVVSGMKTLALSNDLGSIDGSKPFLAYGATPTAGSSLVIGSKEVFQKSPSKVDLDLTWTTAPVAKAPAPTVAVEHLDKGGWHPSSAGWSVTTTHFTVGPISQPKVTTPDLTPDTPFTTTSRSGFVRLQLSGGLGTDSYPVDLAGWIAGGATGVRPTLPVVPTVSSLTLGYTATQHLDLSAPSDAAGRFFHVAPFGHAEQVLAPGRTSVPLLPQFLAGPDEPAEGELHIGVLGLRPPQNLTLLLQVDDGTANPLVVKPDHHTRWSYLRGNEWVPFPNDAVDDGTAGLLASGIVTLAVPADATTEHTLLPAGRHWIRLAVATASDAVCRLVSVAAGALRATYVVPDNGSTSHTNELPAGTITKLDPPDAAVKGVTQPSATFGGRPHETPVAFATRVSERLRHKDRAIALWDYERLILSAFPAIHQARCLNHTQYEPSASGTGTYRELAPGHVTIVTIPDLAVPDRRDPLRPFTSLRTLDEIERFLASRTSCFARLHVRNPEFEEVRVDLRVRLRPGIDETFHTNKLKREITEFLSPWAFRSDARPTFNGRVYKSVLVNFVEERPYIDYVSDVRLFHRLPGDTADGPDVDEVVGSRAISILVSVPAAHHGVEVIRPEETSVAEHCACGPAVD